MSHLEQLAMLTPDILSRRILDVGAGKGSFMIDCMNNGVDISGIEYNPAYIEEANTRANDMGLKLDLANGAAEAMPYPDGSFDFLNFSEVIEHVNDPETVLRESYRVLKDGGRAYLSVPNRFGIRDQHYHLYFVNWMPRKFSDRFIKIFGNGKNIVHGAGKQRLQEMHYYTYAGIGKILSKIGFQFKDIRKEKIRRRFGMASPIILLVYIPMSFLIFDSFHILLEKCFNSEIIVD